MSQAHLNGFAIVTGVRHLPLPFPNPLILTSSQVASGIGQETALSLAEAGAMGILFADLEGDKASQVALKSEKTATAGTYKAVSCEVDITNLQSVQAMVDFALKEFGRFDYLVNSAGISILSGKLNRKSELIG
jgi:NAD(P)-dependent dehydrogenase (short-subunit alcohol dehydrogenase family)